MIEKFTLDRPVSPGKYFKHFDRDEFDIFQKDIHVLEFTYMFIDIIKDLRDSNHLEFDECDDEYINRDMKFFVKFTKYEKDYHKFLIYISNLIDFLVDNNDIFYVDVDKFYSKSPINMFDIDLPHKMSTIPYLKILNFKKILFYDGTDFLTDPLVRGRVKDDDFYKFKREVTIDRRDQRLKLLVK